jgi:hypothetical protein
MRTGLLYENTTESESGDDAAAQIPARRVAVPSP